MSLTYTGILIAIAIKILEFGGVQIGTDQLTEFISTFGIVIAGVVGLYGRYRKGDIKFWGIRK